MPILIEWTKKNPHRGPFVEEVVDLRCPTPMLPFVFTYAPSTRLARILMR